MFDLSEFSSIQSSLLGRVPRTPRRSLLDRINWNNRLLGIVGARGTGKTTLLLQRLADKDTGDGRYLYISADHIHVQATGLYEIASQFFRLAGETIIIDEIHKYNNWQQEIKNLYDAFSSARIFFSGSSTLALQKGKADLSRRAFFYNLPGLSFREYLDFTHGLKFRSISLPELLQNHQSLASEVLEKGPILGHFMEYLNQGVYPFFLEGQDEYLPRILNVLEKVLYEDIPSTTGIKSASVPLLKRILWLVATSQPLIPNIEKISRDIGISKVSVYTYLDSLERAGLLQSIFPAETGFRLVRKPAKIFIENTNLLKAIVGEIGGKGEKGAVRETFFSNQLRSAGMNVRIPKRGDFLVADRYLFEVGGRKKGRGKIPDTEKAFIVRDDTEVGFGNSIPLWLFGFLY
ncbi:ATP-binding protein [Thermodesulfobacteriota bacterium]